MDDKIAAHLAQEYLFLQKVIEDFGDTIIVDQQPQLAGKQLNFVVRSSGKKPVAVPAAQEGEQDAKTQDA